MSQEFVLDAELRSDKGKGASRRLRRADKVPAIIYGEGAEAVPISLDHNEVLQRLEYEAFYSHILTLKVDGKPQEAVLRDVQRHSTKRVILHMDFQRISQDHEINVRVPLHFLNEEKCAGVKQGGGIISRAITEVDVSCLPRDLPEYIEVDLIDLELGESIHLSELKIPSSLTLVALTHGEEYDQAVVTIHKPRSAAEVEEAATVEPAAEAEEAKPAEEEDGES